MEVLSSRGLGCVVVLGGGGALGSAVAATFTRKGWRAITADLAPAASSPIPSANFVALERDGSSERHLEQLLAAAPPQLDAVVCAAGAWAGGSAADDGFLGAAEAMQRACLQPALVAAGLAARRLRPKADPVPADAWPRPPRRKARPALLALTGAAAALDPASCGGMLGYCLAKAATHALTTSLGGSGGGLPAGAHAVCLAPNVLDTLSNRRFMAGSGVDSASWAPPTSWTPPAHLARQLVAWVVGYDPDEQGGDEVQLRPLPKSGTVVRVITSPQGRTRFVLVPPPRASRLS